MPIGFGSILRKAVDNWTAKTPKKAKRAQDIMMGIALAASIVPLIPQVFAVVIPAWVITVSAIAVATGVQFLSDK